MNDAEPAKATLVGNDILFECPKCGKSLVIDSRGVGLNIQCPRCETEQEVPIPEGFDLSKLDQKIVSNGLLSEDGQTVVPAPAVGGQVSSEASGQIKTLQAELQALHAQKQYFARQHDDMLKTVKMVSRQAGELRHALDELSRMLDEMTGPETDGTQKVV